MFNTTKYTKYYYNIVNAAKSRVLLSEIKKERHHIIPKSIGGTNEDSNLVYLTLREHILCHRLLVKMLHGDQKYKMKHALFLMGHKDKYKLTSRAFATIKSSKRNHTEETKKKISAATTGANNPSYGVPCSKERKEKIRLSKQNLSDESRSRISAAKKGIPGPKHTEEAKLKIAKSKIGKKRIIDADWRAKIVAAQTGLKKPPCSDERKRKISAALLGKKTGPMSNEAKAKLSASKKGKKIHTDPITGRRYMA
jgi:hypothetical protein